MGSSIPRIAVMAAMACIFMSAPVSASLSLANFGFPVMVRSSSTVAFNTDHSFAEDLESMNLHFPGFDGLMSPSGVSPSGASPSGASPSGASPSGLMGQGAVNPSSTSMAAPDLSHIGSLFDFSQFRLR